MRFCFLQPWKDSNLRNAGIRIRCLTNLATGLYFVFSKSTNDILAENANIVKLFLKFFQKIRGTFL